MPQKFHRDCPKCGADNHVRKYSCVCGYFWPQKVRTEEPELKAPMAVSLGMTEPPPAPVWDPALLVGPSVISGILSEIRSLEMEQMRLGNLILRKELMLHELFASLGVRA